MKTILLFFVPILILYTACKSEFETVRTSGDGQKMLEMANKLFDEGDYTKAIALYEIILPAYRGKTEGEAIFYKYADAHFKNRSYVLAAHYYKSFSDTYGTSPKREDALFMSAYSNYKLSPRYKLDQSSSEQAIVGFQLFANTFPDSERLQECNALIDQLRGKKERKEFESGKLYYHTKKYNAAVVTLENMLRSYPESKNEEEARYIIAKSNHLLAQNSIYLRQEERFSTTVKSCDRFLKKYPDSNYTREVANFKENSLQEINKIKNG